MKMRFLATVSAVCMAAFLLTAQAFAAGSYPGASIYLPTDSQPGNGSVFDCDGGIDCPGDNFDDLDGNAWYHEYVDYALKNGLMSGCGDGIFAPNAALSRAMLAQILYNMAGSPKVFGSSAFSDVVDGAWYENAVVWATGLGIIIGDNGSCLPDSAATREQVAVMLYRYAGEPRVNSGLSGFTDTEQVSDWAEDAMAWAVNNGIIEGRGSGALEPRGKASRAETATMIMRYLELDNE